MINKHASQNLIKGNTTLEVIEESENENESPFADLSEDYKLFFDQQEGQKNDDELLTDFSSLDSLPDLSLDSLEEFNNQQIAPHNNSSEKTNSNKSLIGNLNEIRDKLNLDQQEGQENDDELLTDSLKPEDWNDQQIALHNNSSEKTDSNESLIGNLNEIRDKLNLDQQNNKIEEKSKPLSKNQQASMEKKSNNSFAVWRQHRNKSLQKTVNQL